jgi:hypothetical protein
MNCTIFYVSPLSPKKSYTVVEPSKVGALEGDGRVGSRCCVCCLVVRHVDNGRRRCSFSLAASDEVGGVGIW